ncbi:hypothetical protein PDE_05948 [Penicillium oxalicum 114-2]|uniref:Uncharacterized protein n=1 Tax=Penicillium oxalicum (strain 114-2 / CGMCC 5302) TaxID=933388 RepID=S7ZL00_PENO1|nr:hypothetical protein PDE_05948 [Penicillium oxalicum 114-2]
MEISKRVDAEHGTKTMKSKKDEIRNIKALYGIMHLPDGYLRTSDLDLLDEQGQLEGIGGSKTSSANEFATASEAFERAKGGECLGSKKR